MSVENVVFVGHLAKNIEITANQRSETLGGSGYHTSTAASFVRTTEQMIGCLGRLGDDSVGRQIIKKLNEYGVDIQGIEIATREKTAWFELEETGTTSRQRKFRGSLEAGNSLISHLPDLYRTAKYIHLATAPPQQQLEWLARFSSQLSSETLITVDAFETFAKQSPEKTLRALNSATGYVFLNEEELAILEKEMSQNLTFKVPVILKRAENGADLIYPDKKVVHAPAKKVEFINGTGAGEALAAVFLTLRSQGIDEIISLRTATEIASLSVEDFGVDHLEKKIIGH